MILLHPILCELHGGVHWGASDHGETLLADPSSESHILTSEDLKRELKRLNPDVNEAEIKAAKCVSN